MAMIEQLSPRLREALTRRAVPFAGGAATLLIVLLMGLDSISLHLTTSYGYLLIPAALGAPTMLPGLRFSPLGQQSGSTALCDDFAALVMVLIVVAVLGRHVRTYPNSSRIHRLLTAWGALVLAGFAAGFFRGLVVARLVAGGPQAYFGYPAMGAVCGAAWALALGWFPGVAALAASGDGRLRRALGRRWAATGRPLAARGWTAAAAAVTAGVAAARTRLHPDTPAATAATGASYAYPGADADLPADFPADFSADGDAPTGTPAHAPVPDGGAAAPTAYGDPAAAATAAATARAAHAATAPASAAATSAGSASSASAIWPDSAPAAAQVASAIPPIPTAPPATPPRPTTPAVPTSLTKQTSPPTTPPRSPNAPQGPAQAQAPAWVLAISARLVVVARATRRRVGPVVGRLLADCRWGWAVLVERLRPLGRRVANRSRRVWARAVREARLLSRIRFGDLRRVRSLSDLRALRRRGGEKHQASRITTP
jgi:hypothetical protein